MFQPLIDALIPFLPGYLELPASYVGLLKGASHKYIKRVPTGKTTKSGKPRYRYFYHVGHGGGVEHEQHFVEGAAFRFEGGHYHIEAVEGDSLTIRHDETGDRKTISKAELRRMLGAHHEAGITAHRARVKQDIADAMRFGASAKQVARLRERAARVGVASETEPKADPVAREKKPTPGKLEAVGDHIWGSRKDLAQKRTIESSKELEEMSYADAAAVVRKSRLIDPLTIDQAQAREMTPGGAMAALAIQAAIREKPDDSKASRAAYVDEIREVMGALASVKTAKDALALVRELAQQRGRPNLEVVEDVAPGATRTEMLKRADKLSEELGRKVQVYQSGYSMSAPMTYRAPAVQKYESLGARFKTMLDKPWKVLADASRADETAKTQGADAVWDSLRADHMGEVADTKGEKAPKAEKKPRTATVSEEVERVGGVVVPDANPDRVRSKFGFREVDYGKDGYMTQADREHHTKALEAATHDLVDVLGIVPDHASFNGRIGIALGARGSGNAKAHYEPGRHAINITKVRGGGSYAHEWGHALDDVVARHYLPDTGRAGAMGFTNRPDSDHLPGDVKASVQGVMAAMTLPADPVKAKAKYDAIKTDLNRQADGHRAEYDRLSRRGTELNGKPASEEARERRAASLEASAARATEQAAGHEKQAKTVTKKMAAYYLGQAKVMRDAAESNTRQAAEVRSRPVATPADVAELDDVRRQQEVSRTKHNEAVEALRDHGKVGWNVSDFGREAAKLGKYWSQPHEMFARAFESYVADELAAKGRRNTYLTSGTKVEGDSRYPAGDERQRINGALRGLVDTLKKGGHLQKAIESLPALTKSTGPFGPLLDLMSSI